MANKDSFLFLFADKNDTYFTEHLMKLDLEQYLYRQLKKIDYDEIFFIENVNGKSMKVYCENKNAGSEYTSKNFIKYTFSVEDRSGRRRYVLNQSKSAMRGTIQNLISRNKDDRYAFVFGENAFKQLYENEVYTLSDLLSRERHKSQFILVEPLDSKEKLPSIPEEVISRDQQNMINEKEGEEFLYDRLNRVNNNVSAAWNPFEKRQMKRMLQRACIQWNQIPLKTESQVQWLCDYLEDPDQSRLFDITIRNKSDLYNKIIDQEMMWNRLNNLLVGK